jgi:hypothetical protein
VTDSYLVPERSQCACKPRATGACPAGHAPAQGVRYLRPPNGGRMQSTYVIETVEGIVIMGDWCPESNRGSISCYGFVVTAVVLMPAFWMFGWSVTVAAGIAWLVGALFMLLSWVLVL